MTTPAGDAGEADGHGAASRSEGPGGGTRPDGGDARPDDPGDARPGGPDGDTPADQPDDEERGRPSFSGRPGPTRGGAAASPVSTCAVAVDVALLTIRDGRLMLLLVRPQPDELADRWALPGRRVRDDETLDDTAHRALWELAGLTAPEAHLEQLRTYGDRSRDPRGRVVSVAYLLLTPTTDDPDPDTAARFFPVEALDLRTEADRQAPAVRFAYDHDRIVPDALERARSKLEYTALATAFVAEPFTLGELRGVYEAVWGVELDPANFRRKVVRTEDFIVPVEGLAKPGPGGGRPAQRYRRGSAERLHPAMLRP